MITIKLPTFYIISTCFWPFSYQFFRSASVFPTYFGDETDFTQSLLTNLIYSFVAKWIAKRNIFNNDNNSLCLLCLLCCLLQPLPPVFLITFTTHILQLNMALIRVQEINSTTTAAKLFMKESLLLFRTTEFFVSLKKIQNSLNI